MLWALLLGLGLWTCFLGMQKWSALPTSSQRSKALLLWGNALRLGALGCLLGIVYFVGKAIAGCG